MNKFFATLLLALALLPVLAACGGSTAPAPQIETQGTSFPPVSVVLDWFPWSNHSGLFIAQERGYFADQGLEVNIYVPGDPSTVLQTVAAGRDDFGISYQPELLIAREQGITAVSIMAMVQHPLNSVMALKESGIAEPKDMKGKKIGSLKTTPSVANAGGGQLARPGKILGIKDMTDNKERPRYQTTHGIHCIPIIKYVKCVICATVLF